MNTTLNNMYSVTVALLLHVLLFGSLIFSVDFWDRPTPVTPLAIQATLIVESPEATPPQVTQPPPPEPEPEPEPDTSEQDRIRAEAAERERQARVEQDRLNRIKQAEEEAAEKRRQEEEAEKRRQEEAERQERVRQEAEAERLADIERQRAENERLRLEAEAALEAERQAEMEAETRRIEAMQATAKQAYIFAISSRIKNRWVRPLSATVGVECVALIKQLPGGEVVSVTIETCNGDAAVRQSIEAAIFRASPLPEPKDPSVFEREIRLTFRPEED